MYVRTSVLAGVCIYRTYV